MSPEAIFSFSGLLVLPGWLLLVVAPGWRRTTRLIAGVLIPLLLAALYVYLVVTHLFGAEGGFGTLADVSLLFQNPYLLLAGWVHYLALDLFVAAWEVRDARRLGIPHLLVIPCLALTFLFGPAGLLLYILLRAISKRVVTVGGAHTPR